MDAAHFFNLLEGFVMVQTNRKMVYAAAVAVLGTLAVGEWASAAVVFSDNFSSSTMNAASPAAPTSNSTNYQVLSTKNATSSSIGTRSLDLATGTTSSGFSEIQARFIGTPIALSSAGDFLKLTIVFTPTNLNSAANNGTINFGLYDSNGSDPVPGAVMNNGQLDDSPGSHPTGHAADWSGYVARIGVPGFATSQFYTRPAQVGETTNEAQDALFNNAGTGAFDNPGGTGIGASGSGATLVNGTEYTFTIQATSDGAGLLTLDYSLSDSAGTIDAISRTTSASTTIATEFDVLAFGYRAVGTGPYSLDASSLTLESNVPIPEPTSMALLGLCGLGLIRRRRRDR